MTITTDTHPKKLKVALIRMDRMGDLMTTLPVDQIESTSASSPFEFHWIINKNLGFLLDITDPVRKYSEFSMNFSFEIQSKMVSFLKSEKFDAAIVFHAPAWVSVALWKANIPFRFGPRSQWHQFLFLNHTLRQKRNESIQHEADYNMDLFLWSLEKLKPSIAQPKIYNLESNKPKQKTPFVSFQKLSLMQAPVSSLLHRPYVVVHPGMGGSALNWSQKNYIQLIQEILKQKYVVVITGTDSDSRWLTQISEFAGKQKDVCWLVGQLSGSDLIAVLQKASGVVAPSTGVIHLAAACGVKCIGLYSPLRAQSPIRWAPRGPQAQFILPELKCPSPSKCRKENCPCYTCVDSITAEKVLAQLNLAKITTDNP